MAISPTIHHHQSKPLLLRVCLVVCLTLLASWSSRASAVEEQATLVVIGTGGVSGVYYPLGVSICRLVNASMTDHGVRCGAFESGGSVSNLRALMLDDLDLMVGQSDVLNRAINREVELPEGAADHSQLRMMFVVHAEAFTLLVREESDVFSFNDLRDKRVNFAVQGSGQYFSFARALEVMGENVDEFVNAAYVPLADQASALCRDEVDVIAYTVGHPSSAIEQAVSECRLRFVGESTDLLDKIVDAYPYYSVAEVSPSLYGLAQEPVNTFGFRAVVAVRDDLSEEVAYQMAKSVIGNIDQLRRMHPALSALQKKNMVKEAFGLSFHPGAKRYYREQGLIEDFDFD